MDHYPLLGFFKEYLIRIGGCIVIFISERMLSGLSSEMGRDSSPA